MDQDDYFGKYSLSDKSIDKLDSIRNRLTNPDSSLQDAWRIISWEESDCTINDQPEEKCTPKSSSGQIDTKYEVQDAGIQATQFVFTQFERPTASFDPNRQMENISEYICELLERNNGKLDIDAIQNMTDSQIPILVKDLNKKLSHKGIYNLCHSICNIEIDLSIRYISHICTDLLLMRVISSEEPSRLLNAAITECLEKFPDDVENLIFIPVLNSDIKDVSTIISIISSLNIEQKRKYTTILSIEVKDVDSWHIPILQKLLVPNLDKSTREKLCHLLWRKSYDFSKDKNYAKLILSFLKANTPTTMQEKQLFHEIAEINDTIFKKPIENFLRTITISP